MTTIVTSDTIGTDTQFTLGTFGTLLLADGVTIASTAHAAIVGNGSFIRVIVNGTVIASGTGVELSDPASGGNSITVGHNGSITSGGLGGVMLFSAGSHLTNFGEISGVNAGVWLSTSAGAAVSLINAGQISGQDEAFYNSYSQQVVLTNTGTIVGGVYGAYVSSDSATSQETIHNRGTIIGDIVFSQGNDVYDGRGGSIEGTVFGQGDDDTFLPGLSVESFDGGDGIDLLDLSKTGGVTASLDNSVIGTRVAEGDTYVNIENITGSLLGRDKLYGDDGANVISGQGGADLLSGGLGKDTLIGGAGKDVLTGGGGNDVFVFNSLSETGDTITDFSAAGNNNDIIWIDASAFGGGLSAGALAPSLFQSSLDNVALTASIRFIFKTADKSLWFDANGSAAGGLTLVADLQANATFGAADILLI